MKQTVLTELNSINLLRYALFKDYSLPEELNYLNLTQERILMTVKDHKSSSMQDIARFIGLEKGPFSQVVNKLGKIGLLEKCRQESDQRVIHLKLTKKGIILSDKIQRHMHQHFEEVLTKLTAAERQALVDSLVTIKHSSNKLLNSTHTHNERTAPKYPPISENI